MNILAENGKWNLIEDENDWIAVSKVDQNDTIRYSKIRNPLYPIAAIAKWGYKPVNHERLDEIMQSDKTSNSL